MKEMKNVGLLLINHNFIHMTMAYSIEDFLQSLPKKERDIVDVLRELMLESIPNVKEKLSYNVPYYFKNKRICFIWPSSVPWGKVKKSGVKIGFCHGILLQDDLEFLEKDDRKQVFTKTFYDVSDINTELLRKYIYLAVDIDNSFRKVK